MKLNKKICKRCEVYKAFDFNLDLNKEYDPSVACSALKDGMEAFGGYFDEGCKYKLEHMVINEIE